MFPLLRSFRPSTRTFVISFAAAACFGAAAQVAPLGADLPSLLEYARANNPELAAMQRESDAAVQRVQPAAALPDPVLRVELENVNNYGNGGDFSLLPSKVGETKYTLMQQFPLWGKRDLRKDAAVADAEQAQARAAGTWAEQAMRLRTAFAQYYLASRTERITKELLDLVLRLEQIAQSRYGGGLAPQQDAIRAQLEQTAMRAELVTVANDKRQLQARINALLGRAPGSVLAEPSNLPPAPESLASGDLVTRARTGNFNVKAEAARLRSAQANRDLTFRNRYPDINLGISPTQMGSRVTTWGVMLEVNIPLQQETRRSQEREAAAMVEATRSRMEAAANQAAADLEEQLSAFDAARRNEELIATRRLPQSQLVLQSALAAYETGKVDFATLLEAQRQVRQARLELLKTQVEAQMRVAEVERTLGEPL